MDKISIIVPAYNAEKHLSQCIESILAQTYSNLEIILIDDGSKDSTGEICDQYQKKDGRIKVIHQPNAGVSKARNAGLDIATGKYVMFIDADDFFEKNACEVLYNEISQEQADYVAGNYIHTNAKGKKWEQPLFNQTQYGNFELSMKDYKKSIFVMNSVVWNKIFSREFIERYQLRFIEGALAEDAIFSIYCYTHAQKGYYISNVVYNYRQNENNSSISTNCSREYFSRINASYKMLYDIFKETNELGFFRYFYARITPYLLCKIVDTDKLEKEEDMKETLQELRWYFCLKRQHQVVILNPYLNAIIDDIMEEQYTKAIEDIKKTRQYRDTLTDLQKERMYSPSEELYAKMSETEQGR